MRFAFDTVHEDATVIVLEPRLSVGVPLEQVKVVTVKLLLPVLNVPVPFNVNVPMIFSVVAFSVTVPELTVRELIALLADNAVRVADPTGVMISDSDEVRVAPIVTLP